MSLGNYFDALLGLALLFAIVWTLRRGRAGAGFRALPEITPETAHQWVPLVAEATGYAVTINDAQRHIVWANEAFAEMTGYTPQEAVGKRVGDLLFFGRTDPEPYAACAAHLRAAMASGSRSKCAARMAASGG